MGSPGFDLLGGAGGVGRLSEVEEDCGTLSGWDLEYKEWLGIFDELSII